MDVPAASIQGRVAWLSIGDWGEECNELHKLADAMAKFADSFHPNFILALGDNFYVSNNAVT